MLQKVSVCMVVWQRGEGQKEDGEVREDGEEGGEDVNMSNELWPLS